MFPDFSLELDYLNRGVIDVSYATHAKIFRPDYQKLVSDLKKLKIAQNLVSKNIETNILQPFTTYIIGLGEPRFNEIFSVKPKYDSDLALKKKIENVADALLQIEYQFIHAKDSYTNLRALEAAVTNIYDNIIRAKDDQSLLPLVKWGKVKAPETFPASYLGDVGIKSGIVVFPQELKNGGLLVWINLNHEVAGHHFLHSHETLLKDLKTAVGKNLTETLEKPKTDNQAAFPALVEYWQSCVEEAACDVLATLNAGPAFGIGLIGALKGSRSTGKLNNNNAIYSKDNINVLNFHLKEEGGERILCIKNLNYYFNLQERTGYSGVMKLEDGSPTKDVYYEKVYCSSRNYPLDVFRVFAVAETIRIISADCAQSKDEIVRLATFLESCATTALDEANIKNIRLTQFCLVNEDSDPTAHTFDIPRSMMLEAAKKIVGITIGFTNKFLEEKELKKLSFWNETDKKIADEIKKILINEKCENVIKKMDDLKRTKINNTRLKDYLSARHILAAATLVTGNADIEDIFAKMKKCLAP